MIVAYDQYFIFLVLFKKYGLIYLLIKYVVIRQLDLILDSDGKQSATDVQNTVIQTVASLAELLCSGHPSKQTQRAGFKRTRDTDDASEEQDRQQQLNYTNSRRIDRPQVTIVIFYQCIYLGININFMYRLKTLFRIYLVILLNYLVMEKSVETAALEVECVTWRTPRLRVAATRHVW